MFGGNSLYFPLKNHFAIAVPIFLSYKKKGFTHHTVKKKVWVLNSSRILHDALQNIGGYK